jgi:hypothetical protein
MAHMLLPTQLDNRLESVMLHPFKTVSLSRGGTLNTQRALKKPCVALASHS